MLAWFCGMVKPGLERTVLFEAPWILVPGCLVGTVLLVASYWHRGRPELSYWGVASLLMVVGVSVIPFHTFAGGQVTRWQAAIGGSGTILGAILYLQGARAFANRDWTAPPLPHLVMLVVGLLLFNQALPTAVAVMVTDLFFFSMFGAVAFLLRRSDTLLRIAAAMFLVRGLNTGTAAELLLDFPNGYRIALNQLLGAATGLLMLASTLRTASARQPEETDCADH